MSTPEPFLFRFKRPCMSPNRAVPEPEFQYDEQEGLVTTIEEGRVVPVVDSKTATGPVTKKADIEKGDDQKDRWMWRR